MQLDLMTDYISPTEAARLIGVTYNRVRQLIATGRVVAIESPNGKLVLRTSAEKAAIERSARLAR